MGIICCNLAFCNVLLLSVIEVSWFTTPLLHDLPFVVFDCLIHVFVGTSQENNAMIKLSTKTSIELIPFYYVSNGYKHFQCSHYIAVCDFKIASYMSESSYYFKYQ